MREPSVRGMSNSRLNSTFFYVYIESILSELTIPREFTDVINLIYIMKKLFLGAAFCVALGVMTACDSQTGCWQVDVNFVTGGSETFYFYGSREEAKAYVQAIEAEMLLEGEKAKAKYKKLNKTKKECEESNY